MKLIQENNRITAKEIAEKITQTERSVQRYMKAMREKGILTRIGSDKGGHWEMKGRVS